MMGKLFKFNSKAIVTAYTSQTFYKNHVISKSKL